MLASKIGHLTLDAMPDVTGVTALALRAGHASAIKMVRNGSS